MARQADPSKKYVQGGTKRQYPSFPGDVKDQRSWGYWCTLWISECLRTLKNGGYFLMFSDWRQLPTATDALQAGGVIFRIYFHTTILTVLKRLSAEHQTYY